MSQTQTIHAPKLIFAASGPACIGFLRTALDGSDQVASRKAQTDAIRSYAAARGHREPHILPNADRDALLRAVEQGTILVVPRLSSLLRFPSDFRQLLKWIFENNVRVEVIELGGDASSFLTLIQKVSEAYEPLEAEIASLRKSMASQEATHDEIIQEVMSTGLQKLAAKFIGIKEDVERIKQEAIAVVTDPVLRKRREQATQYLSARGIS